MQQFDLELDGPAHAELSASSAHRWIACPASVQASRGIPDSSSPAAAEGTAAHELAERCLLTSSQPHDFLGETFNGYAVSKEMADGVQGYVDFCRALPQDRSYIEQRLDFSMWVPDGFGTADFVSIREGEAWVVDLKFGRNIVYADCDQLKVYALGVISAFGFDAQIDIVNMTIVQPRLHHTDTHTMRHTELLKWAKDVLQPAATAALGDNPEFKVGESQCRFCKAAPTCRAIANHNMELLEAAIDEPVTPPTPETLSVEEISKLLPELGLIKSWCDKVSAHASELARDGQEIAGYKLVESRTNRRWSDDQEAIRVMQRLTNEPVYSAKPISPTQAIGLLGAKCDDVNSIIVKPAGKPTLVPVSDKRQALSKPADLLDKLD